jgi:hypothetical protein
LVTGLLAQPLRQLLGVGLFFRCRVGAGLMIAPHRQQIDVDADQLFRMDAAETRGGDRTPIAALP